MSEAGRWCLAAGVVIHRLGPVLSRCGWRLAARLDRTWATRRLIEEHVRTLRAIGASERVQRVAEESLVIANGERGPISLKQRLALELMAEEPNRWWYGLDLVKRTNGLLPRGTLYLTLAWLEECGFLEARDDTAGLRQYHLTARGLAVAKRWITAEEARH